MKQILCRILVLLVVVAAILGLSSCNIFIEQEPTFYDLVVKNFDREVVYGSELDLSGLEIEATTGDDVKYIPVNSSMIVSGDTKTVGAQELEIEYGGFSWTLAYEVFYKVEHIVDGLVYDSQLVSSASELFYVKDPEKNGSMFIGWDVAMPEELTGNVRRVAMFADGLTLPKFSATYGDTLGDLELPEAADGHWEWKHDLSTPVGNAEKLNEFTIVFVPNNETAKRLEFTVNVEVAKKKLTFTILKDSFEYDGKEHMVEYQLSDGMTPNDVNIINFGKAQSSVGTYDYKLRIMDSNYEGQCEGTFEITKIQVTISVLLKDADASYKDNVTIVYGDAFPEHQLIVKDKDGNAYEFGQNYKLDIKRPNMLIAGYYDIIPTISDISDDGVNDLEQYDIKVEVAKLTVEGLDFDPGPPKFTDVDLFYGDKLSKVVFDDHPNGEWTWDFDYAGGDTVGFVGKNQFRAIFTPYDSSYNESVAIISLEVRKKTLTIGLSYNDYENKSVNVTYDGNEHGVDYVIWNADTKEIFENLVISGDVKYTNAGKYTVTIEILDDNYRGKQEFDLVIEKAIPETNFENVVYVVWESGLTLSKIPLPGDNYTWNNVGENGEISPAYEAIRGAGTYTNYKATFTPDDIINYQTVTKELTFVVTHASTSITGLESSYSQWTFDDTEKSLATLFKNMSVTGSGREVKYYYDGKEVTHLKDAGTYLITVVVIGTEQYTPTTATTTVTINKANATVSNVGIDNWAYDQTAKTPYGDKNFSYVGDIVYEYKLKGADDSTYTSVVPSLAGNYVLRARIIGGDGYNWESSEPKYYEFTINKAEVAVPTIGEKSYTGTTLVADIDSSDLYEVKENLGGIDVNNYNVVLALKDSANYKWNKFDSSEITLNFRINQADNSVASFNAGSWIYGDAISHSTTSNFGEVIIKYYEDQNGIKGDEVEVADGIFNAGKYIARAEVIGNDNYKGAYQEVHFEVAKLSITVPELKVDEFKYTGDPVVLEFMSEKPDDAPYTDDLSLSGKTVANNADEPYYYVTLKLENANYMWSDGDEALIKRLPYTIVKAKAEISNLHINGWTYNTDGLTNAPSAETTFGTVSFEYKVVGADDSTYTVRRPSNAGNYEVRATVSGTRNFDGDVETTTFTIAKAQAVITVDQADIVKKFGEKLTLPTATTNFGTVTKDKTEANLVNVNTYIVTYTVEDTDNYYGDTKTVKVIINKLPVNEPSVIGTYTYEVVGEQAKVHTVNLGTLPSYIKNVSGNTGSVAGSYIAKLTLDDNHEWAEGSDGEIPWSIAKAQLIKPSANTTVFTYNGNSQTYTPVNFDSKTMGISGNIQSNANETGYSVVVNISDLANYEWIDGSQNNVELTFVINKLAVNEPNVIGTYTYEVVGEQAKIHTVNLGTLPAYIENVSGNTGSAAGDYEAVLALDSNHKWASGSDGKVQWSIAKAQLIKPSANTTVFTYNGNSQTYTPVNFDSKTMGISGNIQSNANETGYSVVVNISDLANYEWIDGSQNNVELTFVINKLAVNEPTVAGEYLYTSVEREVTLVGFDSSYMSIVPGTNKGTAAGNYIVEITLDDNHTWNPGLDGKVSWTIKKATTSIDNLDILSWTFDQYDSIANKPSYTVTTDSGFVIPDSYIEVWYKSTTKAGAEWSKTVPTDADSYEVKVTVGTDDNVNWTVKESVKSFIVEQLAVNEPTVTGTYTYEVVGGKVTIHTVDLGTLPSYIKNVTGNTGSAAGNYEAVLTLDSNHKWAEGSDGKVQWSIAKVQSVVSKPTINGWIYGNLNSPSASANYGTVYYEYTTATLNADGETYTYGTWTKWIPDGENKSVPEIVGTYAVRAVVDTADNWIGATTEPTVFEITKANPTVTGDTADIVKTYGDTSWSLPVIKINGITITPVITYKPFDGESYEDDPNGIIDNAGYYQATYHVDATTNFNEKTVVINVTINKVKNNDTITERPAKYGDKLNSVSLPTGWSWKDATDVTTVGDAGTKQFWAVFTPTDLVNYETRELQVTVNVAKFGITVPKDVQVEYDHGNTVYSGITSSYFNGKNGIVDNDIISVIDNGGSSVGQNVSLTLTIKAEFAENYYWIGSDVEETVATTTYTIVKDKNSWTENGKPTVPNWTYGEYNAEVNVPTATPDSGAGSTITVTYKLQSAEDIPANWKAWSNENNALTNLAAETYTVKFVVTHPNYADMTDYTTLVISPREVKLPTLAEDQKTHVYLGKDADGNDIVIVPTVTHNDDSTLYTTVNGGNVNVGKNYEITFTLNNPEGQTNYVWVGGGSDTYVLYYDIDPATPVISDFEIAGWKYGQYNVNLNKPSAKTTFGTVEFEYLVNGVWQSEAPVDGVQGTYKVRAVVKADNVNGNWVEKISDPIDLVISRADSIITINTTGKDYLVKNDDGTYTFTKTYTDSAFNLEALIGATLSHTEKTLSYSVSVVENVADSSDITISAEQSHNYNAVSVIIHVVINKADIDKPTITIDATYGDTLAAIQSKLSEYDNTHGNWTWVDANTSVGDQTGEGTRTFKAKFTSTDNNYNSIDEYNVNVKVAKKNISGATIALTGSALTYTGAEQTQNYTVSLSGFDTFTYSDNGTNKATTAGDHTIILEGTGNFYGTVRKEFTIARKSIEDADVIVALTNPNITYNGEAQSQNATVTIPGITGNITFDVTGDTSVTNVNANGYAIIVKGTVNFDGEVTLKFSVSPINITNNNNVVVTLKNSLTYNNGLTLTQEVASVTVKVMTSEGEKVLDVPYSLSDNTATKAGTNYTLTVSADANNRNFTGYATKNFKVAKAEINLENVEWNYNNAFTYDGNKKSVALEDLPYGYGTIYTINYLNDSAFDANVAGAAYTAKATFSFNTDDEGNSYGDNYKFVGDVERTLEWQINPATDNEGTLTAGKASWTYGDTITYIATSKYGTPKIEIYNSENVLIIASEETEGTEATVSIKLSAGVNYRIVVTYETSNNWNSATNVDDTFNVAQSEDYEIDLKEVSKIYGDLLSSITNDEIGTATINSTFELLTGSWTWKDKTTTDTVGDVTTEGNKFVAIFTPDDKNYESKEVEVVINVAKSDRYNVTPNTIEDAMYGDLLSNFAPSGTATLNGSNDELAGIWTWKNSEGTVGNAGTNKILAVFTPNDDGNYESKEVEVTVKVAQSNRYDVTPNIIENATYGDLLNAFAPSGTATLNGSNDELAGIWTWKNSEGTVGNAGTNKILAVFTPDNENYAVVEVEVTVKVAKSSGYALNTKEIAAVYGDLLSSITDEEIGEVVIEGSWTWKDKTADDTVGTVTGASGREFTVVFNPEDSGNYEPKEATVIIIVTASTNYNAEATKIADAMYGDTLAKFTASGTADIEGSWEWVDSTISVGNAGTNTIEKAVRFTPNDKNYAAKELTVTVEVAKSDRYTVDINESLTATYGDLLSSIKGESIGTAPLSGSWTWKDKTATDTVGNKGNNTFTVVFTPEDSDNYVSKEETITIAVSAMTVSVSKNSDTTSLSYRESGIPLADFAEFAFKRGTAPVSLTLGTDYKVMHGETVVTGNYFTDVGSYTVTIVLVNGNYTFGDKEYSFTFEVKKADLTLSGGIAATGDSGVTYGTEGYYNVGVSDLPSASFTNNGAVAAVSPTVKIYTKYENNEYIGDGNGVIKNVGTYYVVYSYDAPEGSNYNDFNEERIVTINPASVTITKPTYSETYFENEFTKDVYGKDANHPVTGVRGETVTGTWAYSDITFKCLESSYTVTFTPDGNNYMETQATVTVPLYTVAKIGSTAYGSIESAIAAVGTPNSETKIIVSTMDAVDGKTIVIRGEGFTVPANVTLVLPYDANGNYNVYKESSSGILGIGGYFGSNEGSYSVENVAITNASCVTKVEVSENTEITVNGTLVVAGQISSNDGGHDRSGHTGGTYAELLLNQGSKIYVNGTMKVYGYVTESAESATDAIVGEVIVNENGILYQPLIIRDFVSGAYLQDIGTKINEHSMLPVNQFEFVNVQSGLTVKYGGTMKVSANLRIQSVSMTVGMDVKLIGTGGGPLFELTNPDSYITINYIPDTNTADLASRTLDDSVLDIHMYNGGKVNPLVLSKDVPIVGEFTISTANGFLPLSWIYDITLHSGDYVSNQSKVHLMPGCNFTVAEDATLDVDNIYVTDNAQSHINAGNGTYPTTKGDAKLTVDGKLMIKYLGGKVYSNCNGATVVIEEPNSSSTVNQVNGGGTIVGAHANTPVFVNGASDVSSITPTVAATIFYDGSTWTYGVKVNIDTNNDGSSDYFVIIPTELNATTFTLDLETPVNPDPDFEFAGWYTDPACTIEFAGNIPTSREVTLYAKWKSNKGWGVVWQDKTVSGNDLVGNSNNNYGELSADSKINFFIPGTTSTALPELAGKWETNTSKQYYFSHWAWYNGTEWVTIGSLDDITFDVNDYNKTYTITAMWTEKVKVYASLMEKAQVDVTSEGINKGTISDTSTVLWYKSGTTITIKASITVKDYVWDTKTIAGSNADTWTGKISSNIELKFKAKEDDWCVTGDTLITLADGTQVRVDALTGNEMLLVWNHQTGALESVPVAYIVDHDGVVSEREIVHLNFSNGKTVKMIGEHVFFDATLNKYVAITSENADEFIGHKFAAIGTDGDALEMVELISINREIKETTVYEVVSYQHLTCFTEGILSTSAYLDPLLNVFDINEDTLAYDAELVQKDIETYGLYTYADFEGLISEEAFELYNAAYLKIAVGKGYITWDDILELIDIYFAAEVKPL